MDKIGIRTIVVNFDDEQLPYMSLVQGDAKTRGFDIVICDSDGKEIPPSNDYVVELIATGSNAPDKPYANRHTIKDGKYRVMIPTEALSKSGFVFLQLVFYQKSTGAVIHTIEQKCPVYRSRGQEVVESNNLYVDITALRLGLERIDELDSRYESMLGEEKIRQEAEKKRNEHEANRIKDEKVRQTNENSRKAQEASRESAEGKRVTAEKERETKFDGWDKTMEGIIPNATANKEGVVKISSLDSESEPYTAVSLGKVSEDIDSKLKDRLDGTKVAFCKDASSSGADTVAIGYQAQAAGVRSVAVGIKSKSVKTTSVAIGSSSEADGINAVSIGNLSKALHGGTIAIGSMATAEAISAVAIGYGVKSDEPGVGVLGVATGDYGTSRWRVPGEFSVGGTKNFEIPHPNPAKTETHVLRHGAVETNSQGDNLYRYKIEAEKDNDLVTINLPDYFIYLNKNIQIWATGVDHFGNAFGTYYPDKEEIVITCEKQGEYNILVIGTRNDNHKSVQSWSDKKEVKLKGTSWTFEEDNKRDVEE